MKPKWNVRLVSFETVPEIEAQWSSADLAALLEAMDYGDTADLDDTALREMTVLSLQDRSPLEATEILLRHRSSERLTKGQIQTLALDLAELQEKVWEHHADMTLHEALFAVGSLASQAFPDGFPTPDAARVTLTVRALNAAARDTLAEGLHEPLLVRLLADGMPDTAVLRRLFEDPIAGDTFPEAASIVWMFHTTSLEDGVTVQVVSSGYWLDPIADSTEYTSSAHADATSAD